MKQHDKLLLGFVLGVAFGLVGYYYLPSQQYPFMTTFSEVMTFIGATFLRLIFMVVVPLILSALMLGTMELGKGAGLGKVAGRSLLFTILLSGTSVVIAVVLTNVLKPGAGLVFDKAALAQNAGVLSIQKNAMATAAKPWYQYIVDLLPQNPIDSAARAFSGEIVAVMVFALFFGWALSRVVQTDDHPTKQVLESIFQACMKIIGLAMTIAPFAIFGIVFNTAYRMGAGFLGNVAYYALVVVIGLLIQFFIVYGLFIWGIGRTNPFRFFSQCKDVYLYAFTTASSNATLPVAMECGEKVLKLPPRIVRFVLTIGASANQNGSALFEGVTVIFLAQVFGVDLTIGQQVLVVLMSMLAGVGTAGVPGGALPLIVVVMVQVGIPAEGIGLILGVDRFLDMCRTTLNVGGDLVIAKLVTATVGEKTLAALRDEQPTETRAPS
ncbi:dicarboxylate/amino acid:cation symporter [Rhodoplanes roseus]|uniref:Dicarboxylate/amino acid:cation symporter n=1 Tax=Rhodoplanes roseus TaxID=29409 RepID=A0A327L6N5_9BRAD|nr:dicarboxylate/amino acid:cation symporter [Rhodoplanes roseus]RAI43298.1 dicarboxylate/amino acid:cation symporter [Rhodoplanes roseus]